MKSHLIDRIEKLSPEGRRLLALRASRTSQSLVSFVTGPASDQELEDLRISCSLSLPDHMVPSTLVSLDSIPRTPAGKVDRSALSHLPIAQLRTEASQVLPSTNSECAIAEIWQEVLGLVVVGVDENFFELGGDSLLSIRILSRMAKAGLRIEAAQLLMHPTVREQAALVDEAALWNDEADAGSESTTQAERSGKSEAPSIGRTPRGSGLPLSFAQERLWFLDRFAPGNSAYNVPMAIRIIGELNLETLQKSLNEVIRRHEVLRTSFPSVGGSALQQIADALEIDLQLKDLSDLDRGVVDTRIQEIAGAEFSRSFKLDRGPLLRAKLLKLGADEHVLILVVHHIVSDGWSIGILLREWGALYRALGQEYASPLDELPIQYADFAVWQRGWLKGERLEAQLAYWREELSDLPALQLPTDRVRPPVQTYTGSRELRELPPELGEALISLSNAEGSTLFMTMLAAFAVLLSRYSGQEDITVGSPIANRRIPEIEGLIGFFVNSLVMRMDVSEDPDFRTLLSRVRTKAMEAYDNQDVPFEKLVEDLKPTRDMSRNPLFQVMFQVHSAHEDWQFGGFRSELLLLEIGTTHFDLEFEVWHEPEGLNVSIVYNTDLFDRETIVRMAGHFEGVLTDIVRNPDSRLSELSMLSARERRQLLVDWNDTATNYPRNACVHTLFEQQAASTPDGVAISYAGIELSYAELNARANRLARALLVQSVGTETLVAVCAERGLELAVGLLAVLKSGAAYVPLDPSYPKARLAYMLKDAAPGALLTQRGLVAQLPAFEGPVLCLDEFDWERGRDDNPTVPMGASNLAYVIYTSGSTGQPKGTCIEHRGVVRLVKNTNYIEFGPEDVCLQLAPISFDACTFEVWGPLLNGSKLVIYPSGVPSLAELAAAIVGKRVTTLLLTASLFRLMVDNQLESLRGVRQLIAGGEALSVPHVRRMLASLKPNCRLINGYGPTENTTLTTCYSMDSETRIGQTVPIGVPLANTQCYVLDAWCKPVPIGVNGELYTGGDGLARGYLNQPVLTAEKFIDNPFGSGKLYRTGDTVRYLADGNIEFVGRLDNQVKLRGFRIETGEIETVLREHESVEDAVVILGETTSGDNQLIAYVVALSMDQELHEGLRDWLRLKLPDYMIPATFVELPTLPLTPNGKVDRGALPSPSKTRDRSSSAYVAPRSPLEQSLVNIWQRLLGIEQIGIFDNFFDLGGHSLLAVRLFGSIEKEVGKSMPLATLFHAPTIEMLAREIETNDWRTYWSSLVAIQPKGNKPPLFAVPGVGGNVLCFVDLARELGDDQPFFGLQSVGLDGSEDPLGTIEEIAAHNIEEVRSKQAYGPYYLLGACVGGVIAFEMARQLEGAGEKIALLALLDPAPLNAHAADVSIPSSRSGSAKAVASIVMNRLQLYGREFRNLTPNERWSYVFSKTKLVLEAISQRDLFRGDRSEFHSVQVVEATIRAMHSYVAKPYPGSASIYIAKYRALGAATANRLDWRELIDGDTNVFEIPAKDSSDMISGAGLHSLIELLTANLKDIHRNVSKGG